MVPGDPRKPGETSGLRLGTPACTTRGFKEREMREVSDLIALAAEDIDRYKNEITARVAALCEKYPVYPE